MQAAAAVVDGVRAERRVAAGPERVRDGALGLQAGERLGVGDRLHGRPRGLVIGASLQRERALAGGGDEARGVEHRGDLGLAAQAHQAGAGEHERVEAALAELAQARVDVAAHRHHLQVLARGPQLRGAAHAAGAHARPGGQLLQASLGSAWVIRREGGAPRHAQHVLGRRARWRAQQRQTIRQLGGDVLGGVHREVDLPSAQRALQLVHPAGLVASGRESLVHGVAAPGTGLFGG